MKTNKYLTKHWCIRVSVPSCSVCRQTGYTAHLHWFLADWSPSKTVVSEEEKLLHKQASMQRIYTWKTKPFWVSGWIYIYNGSWPIVCQKHVSCVKYDSFKKGKRAALCQKNNKFIFFVFIVTQKYHTLKKKILLSLSKSKKKIFFSMLVSIIFSRFKQIHRQTNCSKDLVLKKRYPPLQQLSKKKHLNTCFWTKVCVTLIYAYDGYLELSSY